MVRMCRDCNEEMVEDVHVTVKGALYGLKITQKKRGLFTNANAEPKASVCKNCGAVALYIENPQDFGK